MRRRRESLGWLLFLFALPLGVFGAFALFPQLIATVVACLVVLAFLCWYAYTA